MTSSDARRPRYLSAQVVMTDSWKRHRRTRPDEMMSAVGMGDVNSNPRRWTDRSAQVRVVEGWHPSRPDQVGYNLMIDGEWIGSFESLDDAARAASRASSHGPASRPRKVTLMPLLDPARRRDQD